MAAPNEDRLRQMIRDELDARLTPPRNVRPQNVYERTQQLLQDAATATVSPPTSRTPTQETASPQGITATAQTVITSMPRTETLPTGPYPNPWAPAPPPRRTSHKKGSKNPSHPWRIGGKGASGCGYGGRQPQPKHLKTRLLTRDLEQRDRYRFEQDDILMEGQIKINPGDTEEAIRKEIRNTFLGPFPFLKPNSFEFLECERSTVWKPCSSHSWDFDAVKSNVGTGRLYVRLLVPDAQVLPKPEPPEVINVDQDVTPGGAALLARPEDAASIVATSQQGDAASVTATTQLGDATAATTQENATLETLVEADLASATTTTTTATTTATVDLTVANSTSEDLLFSAASRLSASTPSDDAASARALLDEVLQQQESSAAGCSRFFTSFEDAIAFLVGKVDHDDQRRLRVDEGEELEEVVPYYKSPNFNPSASIKVTFRNQPGADAGGLLRQLFTNLFDTLQTNDDWFIGSPGHRLPSSNVGVLMSGIFRIIGQIISHAVVLTKGTCGPLLFSPAVYYYLTSGDLSSSSYITIEDVTAMVKGYVEQIMEANDTDGDAAMRTLDETLSEDTSFQSLMYSCGNTALLSAALDQIREGMETLGLLGVLENNPLLFQPLFVHDKEINAEQIIRVLRFDDNCCPVIESNLRRYLEEADKDELRQFVRTISASLILPKEVKVVSSNPAGINASTCTLKLDISKNLDDYETLFLPTMKDKVRGKSFTTV